VKVIALVAVVVVVLAVAVLVWRPWRSVSCVDDGDHVVDEEIGLCYVIPEGWEPKEIGAEPGEDGSAIAPVEGSGFVLASPFDDRSNDGDVELAARMQAGPLSGNGPKHESIRTEPGTVDGHPSATATYADAEIWVMVTVVDLGGRLAGLSSVCPVHETEKVAQIKAVHESLVRQRKFVS
jgi:predicted Zn-dependent protease